MAPWPRALVTPQLVDQKKNQGQSMGEALVLDQLARIPGRSCFCQILVPQDPPHRGMYDKSVEAESPHVGGVWKFEKWAIKGCKEQLPAPGNRSNERRYRKKDLATTEEKKVGTGEKREGDEKSRGREKWTGLNDVS
ncbi:hypothetical protein TNCV_3705431 [Trichonephila clavipes]|nr:hypothetical protein TNCV_3705431 [Trichonephila clavipes]